MSNVENIPTRTQGYADVLVGLQYGDEGKAKIIDLIAPEYDIIARFNGGANAGHTIDTPYGRVVLQQIPSAVFHPEIMLYIGSGCAINAWKLRKEIELLESSAIDLTGRLIISDRCAVVQPVHFLVDELNSSGIGTTKNGIGPCYADRAARVRDGMRVNFQLCDVLADPDSVLASMRKSMELQLARLEGDTTEQRLQLDGQLNSLLECVERLRPYVETNRRFLTERVAGGARVLFEGAQSVELDVIHGDQPFVTSSHTVPAYAYVGGDLSPRYHRHTIGVAKAIVSRVGKGPFRSELGGERSERYFSDACATGRGSAEEQAEFDPETLLASADPMDLGIALRMMTGEYGAGTGRPRRIGILDLSRLRDAVETFGVNLVYLNKVDCLALYGRSSYQGIPVQLPPIAAGADPEIKVLPAFSAGGAGEDVPQELPQELYAFKDVVEGALGVPVAGFGLGPERDNIAQFVRPDNHRPQGEETT
ncbi:MAG TPA: adenylosuccinate synthetase [Actinoplanes sp.]|nr:adenylosuccinate synthetase [Actinoplanes sp.]